MPGSDLALLLEAAEAAGRIARRFWRQGVRQWDKDGDAGPVTEADKAVNEMLEQRLRTARPDYGWLSEESPDTTDRVGAARTFIIDPIDGTRAFIAGERGFAHALAVVEDGEVVTAVVYLPLADRLYAARKGGGATMNADPIRVGQRTDAEGASVFAASVAMTPEHWPGGTPGIDRHFRASLAYRLCLVAEGSFDAVFTVRPVWEWDAAAGSLIAAEAGARVTGASGEAIRFNARIPQTPGLLVASPALHDDFLRRRVT